VINESIKSKKKDVQSLSKLLYRNDIKAVRKRLTMWWNGEDIGRPVLMITAPRSTPLENIHIMPEPKGWLTNYSTSNFGYRLNLGIRTCINTHYLGEAVPNVPPDLGTNCLALYLGCRGLEQRETVYCESFVKDPESHRFELDPNNFYWDFTQRLVREFQRLGRGKFLTSFPDLVEGLDTLAAMRGTETLLMDLIERSEWVHHSLKQITEAYFHYYDVLYNLIKDETGGSLFWAWAPGRMAKLQCDFSTMISADMFAEFMVPALEEMSNRLDYCMYHWDGPGAIVHHDHLLSIPGLDMLQWTPGSGVESTADKRWWPLYHKTVDAGKKILIDLFSIDQLITFKKEFGPKLKSFMIYINAQSVEEAEQMLKIASY
jgi:hypothetical protein